MFGKKSWRIILGVDCIIGLLTIGPLTALGQDKKEISMTTFYPYIKV